MNRAESGGSFSGDGHCARTCVGDRVFGSRRRRVHSHRPSHSAVSRSTDRRKNRTARTAIDEQRGEWRQARHAERRRRDLRGEARIHPEAEASCYTLRRPIRSQSRRRRSRPDAATPAGAAPTLLETALNARPDRSERRAEALGSTNAERRRCEVTRRSASASEASFGVGGHALLQENDGGLQSSVPSI